MKDLYVHKTAQFFSVGWPVNFWRIESQKEKDFEWFEHKYPGWYAEFGDYWKWYEKKSHPGETNMTFDTENGYAYPHRCWSCMVPCLIRKDIVCDRRSRARSTPTAPSSAPGRTRSRSRAEYEGRATPGDGPLQRSS